MMEASLATVAKDGNIVTPVCFEFNAERNYNIDPVWVGKEAGRLALSALKTKRIETSNTKNNLYSVRTTRTLLLYLD